MQFSTIEGINVRKNSDAITLDYADVEWLKQNFATRSESVTPFLISFWQGTMELTPASDTWVDTARLEAKIIQTEGNYTATMDNLATELRVLILRLDLDLLYGMHGKPIGQELELMILKVELRY